MQCYGGDKKQKTVYILWLSPLALNLCYKTLFLISMSLTQATFI